MIIYFLGIVSPVRSASLLPYSRLTLSPNNVVMWFLGPQQMKSWELAEREYISPLTVSVLRAASVKLMLMERMEPILKTLCKRSYEIKSFRTLDPFNIVARSS